MQIDLTSEAPTALNDGIYARNALLIATGDGGAITWKLLSTTVPGVNVNGMGYVIVSGSPSASTAQITVTATNSYGQTSPPTILTVSTRYYRVCLVVLRLLTDWAGLSTPAPRRRALRRWDAEVRGLRWRADREGRRHHLDGLPQRRAITAGGLDRGVVRIEAPT